MRLKACLGIILLGLGACTTIPGFIRLEVDGSTVEFNKKPDSGPPAPGPGPATTEEEATADVPER